MTPLRVWLRVFIFFAGALAISATELPGPLELKPLPSVVSAAKAHAIPLDGFELAGIAEEARPGDALTVMFTIQEGAVTRQWLAELRLARLTEREAKSKPGSGLGLLGVFQTALHTDTGHEYRFPSSPAALELRTIGPFDNSGAAMETKARVLATREYLAHGLAPLAEIELRLRAAGKKDPGLSYMFAAHFSAGQMAAAEARAQAAGFTVDDERTFAEGIFALVQFANLSFQADGVAAILRKLIDPPTLLSGAFLNLDWPAVQLERGADWGLPGARVFRVPYDFQSKTNAKGTLFITAPLPPLLNLAGIVGLTIDRSSKTSTKRLIVRVIAGHCGSL